MRYLVAVLIKGGLATSLYCGEKTTKVKNVPDGLMVKERPKLL